MAQSFAFDDNNDIYLDDSGNIAIAKDIDAVLFACQNAAQTILGEMRYRTDEGMPNFQTIWRSQPNIPQFRSALIETLKNVANVIGVEEPVINVKDNVINYSVLILTTFGEAELTDV